MTEARHETDFEAGLANPSIPAAGCWLLDAHGLLPDAADGSGPWRWDVTRGVGRMDVKRKLIVARADGNLGKNAPKAKPKSMQEFIRLVAAGRAYLARGAGEGAAAMHGRVEALRAAGHGIDTVADDLARALDALGPFLATLDPHAVEVSLSGGMPRHDLSCYAGLDRTVTPDAPLAAALRLEPLWPDTLARMWDRFGPRFAEAVADGPRPLRELLDGWLASSLGGADRVPGAHATAARLTRLDPAGMAGLRDAIKALPVNQGDPARVLATRVAALPPNWIPADAAEWVAFAACLPAVDVAMRRARGPAVATYLDAKGDWPGYARRLAAASGREARRLSGALKDVGDMHRSYAAQVLVPALALSGASPWRDRSGDVDAARTLLEDGRRLCRVLETSRRWHDHATLIAAALPRDGNRSTPTSWPVAWPEATLLGVTVRELADQASLDAEGAHGPDPDGLEGLGHCVGAYAYACLAGDCRILSLRDAVTGIRLSTAQVTHRAREPVAQHRGRRNDDAPDRAGNALAAYIRAVRDGVLHVATGNLAPVAVADDVTVAAGYDCIHPGSWEKVRDLWDPFVPRRLRKLTSADMAREFEHARRRSIYGDWRPIAEVSPSPVA